MKHGISKMMGVAAALLLVVGWSPTAAACGGFFCNNMSMDQVGEQIIFGVDGTAVTATISIAFEGEAEDFGWVIPVLGVPTISLAPQGMFTQLNNRTRPNHWLQWDYSATGECAIMPPMASADDFAEDGGGAGGGGVEVIDSSEVGPYATVTLQSDDAEELFTWLNDNGFVQPEGVLPLIEHYLENDFLFVAMKMKQGAGAGEIQPVTLGFEESEPCVPLVLTQIAAQPDMPVLIWVLSDAQATPRNWFKVEVNQKKINWMGNGSNYEEILTLAIDEAAGHGFTTEYAMAADMTDWLYQEGQWDTEALKELALVPFLEKLQWDGYPRDTQLLEMMKKYIPMSEMVNGPEYCQDEDSFYNWSLFECVNYMSEDWTFDAEGFANELQERVVEPMMEAQKILDHHTYMTRLYSTVSPAEMTRDPLFHFNTELEDVSNQHVAEAVGTCTDDGSLGTVVITLENGESFTLEGPFDEFWGWMDDDAYGDPVPEEGAAASIALVGEDGEPVEVDPADVKTIDARLDEEDPSIVLADLRLGIISPDITDDSDNTGGTDVPGDPTTTPDPTDPIDDDSTVPDQPPAEPTKASDEGGCAGGSEPISWWPAALALLALVPRRRLV